MKLSVSPAWLFRDEQGRQLDLRLFELLRAIHETGKLTEAAAELGVSYRHAWNLIGKWSGFFNHPLVAMQRGKGASLTALGERLLWAERRVTARLTPQLENLASEINIEINQVLRSPERLIRINASHGFAIASLPGLVHAENTIDIDLQFRGSLDALHSLHRSTCDLAGFHVPDVDLGPTVIAEYSRWLKPQSQSLIKLAVRTQGLIVPAGNPKKISGIEDLIRPDVTFVNRQRSSGTSTLLGLLLESRNISDEQIRGIENKEFTHTAVAAYVASGMADAGLGVEPAAWQFGLDFIPIAREHYYLIGDNKTLERQSVKTLIGLIQSEAYQKVIVTLPGYDASDAGVVTPVLDTFKWLKV